ncbi:MAG: DNA polymerase III subunit gamma/tau [Clostridia bacterium]|nr:DNA polymerase III subunit gamma/tau [Clostridia bacterium]
MYLALYRKYRPQNFSEVIGQKHIVQTLKNQIDSDKIGHAYLFTGSRGTGKTSIAKIFARAINCANPTDGDACGKCDVCTALSANNIDILEIDAASNNGVDEIRDLREKVKYPPVNGKFKVYIIDEVHMLSTSAFNALLKTLEEPPKHVVFILATTEVHKLPATILSRCMRFDFKLLAVDELVGLLEKILKNEKVAFEDKALSLIARAGEGSVRDTLSIADMCISYSGDNLTFDSVIDVLGTTEKEKLTQISDKILSRDLGGALLELDTILSAGKSPLVLSRDMISYFRDLLILYTLSDRASEMVVVPENVMKIMKAQAVEKNYSSIVEAIEELSRVEADLRYSVQPRIVLETVIIKIIADTALTERVEALEKMLKNGVQTVSVQGSVGAQPAPASQRPQEQPRVEAQVPLQSKAQTGDTNSQVFADLINFLRNGKHMSLLAIVRSSADFKVEGKNAIFFVEDKETQSMLGSDKYGKTLIEYFAGIGLECKVELAESKQKTADLEKLKGIFGNKLEIKE